jgi:hypothetical protein
MNETARVPARRPVLRWLKKRLDGWLVRHQLPFNFWIHMVGIPMALAGLVLVFVLGWSLWYVGAGAFVGGYVLQYIGHRAEGNDVGEWAGIKRLLGLPCVSISPRWQQTAQTPSAAPLTPTPLPRGERGV